MRFLETTIQGAYHIFFESHEDERGFFARNFCQQEFDKHGVPMRVAQCNVSGNKFKGTLRGLHYQEAPYEEEKIVSCIQGKIYDVVVDLRKNSLTYMQWASVELPADSKSAVYIPKGCAHGFQTLEDNSTVLYLMSQYYSSEHARGIRWDDPALNIAWPVPNPILSEKDKSWPFLGTK